MKNQVCLAWATKKRHITINGKVLCKLEFTTGGYSVKNGQYNSLTLHGLPDKEKNTDDIKYCHSDGFIEFKLLSEQKYFINTKSICKKCLKEYNKLFKEKK